MTLYGVDAPGAIPVNVLKANGKSFISRYLNCPGHTNPSMCLTAAEVDAYLSGGIHLIVNVEWSGTEFYGGQAAGERQAQAALAALPALGSAVAGCPMIFSCDSDPGGYEAAIQGYAHGIANVLGYNRSGIYAGHDGIDWAVGTIVKYGWQSNAWNRPGGVSPHAQLLQFMPATMSGYSVDPDETVNNSDADFGQVGAVSAPTPSPQEDLLTMRTVTTASIGGSYDDTFVLQPNSTKVVMKRTSPLSGSLAPGPWSSDLPGAWIDCVKAYKFDDPSHGPTEVFVGVGTDGNLYAVYWTTTPHMDNWSAPEKIAP